MKKLNLFSNLWSSLGGSQKDDGSTRLRVVIDSLSTRYRVCSLKLVSVFAILLTIGVGNAWGAHTKVKAGDLVSGNKYIITATYSNNTYYLVPSDISTSTNRGSYSSSLTEAAAWTFTEVEGGWTITTMVEDDLYYLYNSSSSANSVASYSDDDDPLVYTIEETSSGANTVYISGNSRYLALYTSGSNWRAYSSTTQANSQPTIQLYSVGSSTYTVTYNGNGNTGGSVPSDATAYSSGTTVTAKGNTGSLVKTGWTFAGWNTAADGSGTTYAAGSGTFSISANTTLYAKWTCTVTWSVDGATNVYPAQTVTYNSSGSKASSVPTPNPASYCGDKFVGWTTESDVSQNDDTGLNLFTTVAGSPNLNSTGSTTFYAVFADYDE